MRELSAPCTLTVNPNEIYGQGCIGRRNAMPNVPPDPRDVINARIHHFKKQSQKLNMEFLEAEAELERAKKAVRQSRQAPVAIPTPRVVTPAPTAPIAPGTSVAMIRPFADGVGYSLAKEGTNLWFDNEIHAINYAQEVFPQSEILVLHLDGTVKHHYGPTSTKDS
jgi:hypothetical protein